MTKENRRLLLIEICARLPYGVKAQHNNKKEIFGAIEQIEAEGDIDLSYYDEDTEMWKLCCTSIDNIKPYLRPMSSMTEEERVEYRKAFEKDFAILEDSIDAPIAYKYSDGMIVSDRVLFNEIDWLNKKMFDFRGLIPMGLALEAKEDMYKTE